jgi:hypothetical protein
MGADEIKKRCEDLMGASPGGQVVQVSAVGKYFIPDSATGTKADMQAGTNKHQEREDEMDDIAWEDTWDELTEEVTISEWFIRSPVPGHDGIILSGKIDAVQFLDSRPTFVLERKFPRERNLDTVYPSERVQAWTYCYMLDALEFQTDDLQYCVLKLPRSIDKDDADRFDQRLFGAAKKGDLDTAAKAVEDELGNGTAFTKQFAVDDHKEDFEEALAHQ